MSDILGLDNLKFFTAEGKQIIMQKQYSVSWEIIPCDRVFSAFIDNPSGHFEISNNAIDVIVDNPGMIRPEVKFPLSNGVDNKILSKYSVSTTVHGIYNIPGNYISPTVINGEGQIVASDETAMNKILFFCYKYVADEKTYIEQNKIHITISTGDEVFVEEYELLDFFYPSVTTNYKTNGKYIQYSFNTGSSDFLKESVTDDDASNCYGVKASLFSLVKAKNTEYADEVAADEDLIEKYGENITTAMYMMAYNVDENQYPYVRYVGTCMQEKVSADFIAATTIVIVNDNGSDAETRYTYPDIQDGNIKYRMHFKFQKDSEMFFVSSSENNVDLVRSDSMYMLNSDEAIRTVNANTGEGGTYTLTNAMHFTVGFQSSVEGCYKNAMGMFIRDMENDVDYFIGIIQFMTEVEDEDERFRTLLTNFGIPDPIKYPNVFKQQDVDEEGCDWTLVNKKSKELFLYYDEIFPYVGTYKALFNAIRYLGYQDIIFKEWYKIKDKNDKTRYVAIQNYDTSTGKSIESTLKKYGVEYGEYDRYTKLNRLSMIYHFDMMSNESENQLRADSTTVNLYRFIIGSHSGNELGSEDKYKYANYTLDAPKDDTENVIIKMSSLVCGHFDVDPLYDNVFVSPVNQNGEICLKLISGTFRNHLYSVDSEGVEEFVSFSEEDEMFITYNVKMNICSDLFVVKKSEQISENEIIDHSDQFLRGIEETVEVPNNGIYYNANDITKVIPVYEYRCDEVLAKLYSVKHWIETFITGVNCYISDINGEGIVLERMKSVGYVTEHEFKDIQNEGYFTPNCRQSTDFLDSSTILTCSLNEFGCVTLEEYKDYMFENFVHSSENVTVNGNTVTIYDSPPIGAWTVADEFKYKLELNAESGTLYEFASIDSSTNPIYVADGEITFFDQTRIDSSIITDELSVIEIIKGNLRELCGNWSAESILNTNVKYSIHRVNYADGSSFIVLTDEMKRSVDGNRQRDYAIRAKGCIILSPKDTASFVYTANNKWEVPLFVISDYVILNQYRSDVSDNWITAEDLFDSSKKYVLEIIEGSIKFRNHTESDVLKNCKGAVITFSETAREEESGEQVINIKYEYESDRLPIYKYKKPAGESHDTTSVKAMYEQLEDWVTMNTFVDIPVNRLGDYRVSVYAYDAYNNIFHNTADDICHVGTRMPSIDVIANVPYSNNNPSFYKYNKMPIVIGNTTYADVSNSMEKCPLFPMTYKIYGAVHDIEDNKIVYDSISYAIDTPKNSDYLMLTNMTEKVDGISGDGTVLHMSVCCQNKQNIYVENGGVNLCLYDENTNEVLWESRAGVISVTKPEEGYVATDTSNGSITVDIELDSSVIDFVNDKTNNKNLYVIADNSIELPLDTSIENDTENRIAFIPIYLCDSSTHTDEHIDKDVDEFEENYSIDVSLRLFPLDTMVKLTAYVEEDDVCVTLSETAYRIIDTSIHTVIVDEENPENSSVYCGYVIDGNVNLNFMNDLHNVNVYKYDSAVSGSNVYMYKPDDVKFKLQPITSKPVKYMLRVNKDALEESYIYSDYLFYGLRTTVEFNTKQLLFDSYFDDSFAFKNYRYEPTNLYEMWWTFDSEKVISVPIEDIPADTIINDRIVENLDEVPIDEYPLYLYRNFPITVKQGTRLIIRAGDDIDSLEKDFKKRWTWKSRVLEDNSNWDNHKSESRKIELFESVNEVLSVKPFYLGYQSIELECIDKYGNRIVNNGGGNLCVVDENYVPYKDYSKEYFTVEALEHSTITFTIGSGVTISDLKSVAYSTDEGKTWKTLNNTNNKSSDLTVSVYVKSGDKVLWRCVGNSTYNTSSKASSYFSSTNIVNVTGNIMSLLYGENYLDQTSLEGKDYCFYNLFYNATQLINAGNLILPATTLASHCYDSMFYGCTSLTVVPQLPATELKDYCYSSMFKGCTSLVTPPQLFVTTMASHCYESMFEDCTSLKNAPELPATELAEYCYSCMFKGCTGLERATKLPAMTMASHCYESMFENCNGKNFVNAPQLPATTMAEFCYSRMFKGCTYLEYISNLPDAEMADSCCISMYEDCIGLENMPELPAMTMAPSCYHSMFKGCTSLVNLHDLPATTLATSCYQSMFSGCSSLKNIPLTLLPATTMAPSCYQSMFSTCKNIETLPAGLLPATTLATSCYQSMFSICEKFKFVIGDQNTLQKLPATTLANSCYNGMFQGCNSIETLPAGLLPATTLAQSCYHSMFYGCKKLVFDTTNQNTLQKLPATTLAPSCYYRMFFDCTNITIVPSRLLDATTLATSCYSSMFYSCDNLTSAPDLPATTLAQSCYQYMFFDCKKLTSAPSSLPASRLASYCYQGMFQGCIILTSAPQLSATTLASYCYQSMFKGCTNLSSVQTTLSATKLESYCYDSMFENCMNLTTAPQLSATTLASYCCQNMFKGCARLTSVQTTLSATTMTSHCYDSMFDSCVRLTTAPKLPATTLASYCYQKMFNGCTSLNSITCLATNISASNCTTSWVNNVASSGTFKKAASMENWTRGVSGIPDGWTVQTA